MNTRIKGWSKFQHFKDRRPPWVKLYRDILEDPDWHDLDGECAKVLISLWLIASEDEEQKGGLPDTRKLAFRLRMTEAKLKQALTKLSHWLIQDDISVISARYQVDAPETETETETETESVDRFAEFWKEYPRKVAKADAMKAWAKAKVNGDFDKLLSTLAEQKQTKAWSDPQFIPHAATWINGRRWEDEALAKQKSLKDWI